MLTATEAEADCPQNPEQESPAGNQTPLSEYRSHLPQKHLILIISRPTCTTYFLINTKFHHLYMHLLILPP